MPPIGMVLGGADFSELYVLLKEGTPTGPYATLAAAKAAKAVTINIGLFVNTVISFVIVAFAVFMVVKSVNTARRAPAPAPAAPPRRRRRRSCSRRSVTC
jgi:large conductance mechanosensitive channel